MRNYKNEWILLVACLLFLVITPYLVRWVVENAQIGTSNNNTDILRVVDVFSTFLLGMIAVYQGVRAHKVNERLTIIESNRDEMDQRPSVLVTKWGGRLLDGKSIIFSPKCLLIDIGSRGLVVERNILPTLFLYFTNTSPYYLIFEYSSGIVRSGIKGDEERIILKLENGTSNQQTWRVTLAPAETKPIGFYGHPELFKEMESHKIELTLILENRHGKRYIETFDFYLILFDQNYSPNVIYTTLMLQNYAIEPAAKNGLL